MVRLDFTLKFRKRPNSFRSLIYNAFIHATRLQAQSFSIFSFIILMIACVTLVSDELVPQRARLSSSFRHSTVDFHKHDVCVIFAFVLEQTIVETSSPLLKKCDDCDENRIFRAAS